ncbi:MAG: hypothetical protein Q9167_002529 [Letrouitia subvulpina]
MIGPVNIETLLTIAAGVLSFSWLAIGNVPGLFVFSAAYGFFAGAITTVTAVVDAALCPALDVVGVRMGMLLVPWSFGLLVGEPVAGAILGSSEDWRNVVGNQYVKNYEFDFSFGPPWGNCSVTMTSVLGHLTGAEFAPQYRRWQDCRPIDLFDAPVLVNVDPVRSHVIRAAQNPVPLDDRQVNAVAARIELDLRLGASFTRFQTLTLQKLGGGLAERVISYGSCQFPTLGFVVDRYFRVKNFVPEKFWSIKVIHNREDMDVVFSWRRYRLFDRMSVVIIFERCLSSCLAVVTKLQKKPTRKWRPVPLTTVELQRLGSMYLRMDSQRVMKIAEELYNKGWISYPRTETDQFDKDIDLKRLIEKQTQDHAWGPHAQTLLNGAFKQPRGGRNNDQAHPPIHPVNYTAPGSLSHESHRVYEFIVRRFLACCSEDAIGQSSLVEIDYGGEIFFANGLLVLQKNYLLVYPYEKWESSQQLPDFREGESFEPTEANIMDGETSAPDYLTEPELIGLMDANGIGTDATMAEHIEKIKVREYVMTHSRSRGGDGASTGGRGNRGGHGGRGGGSAGGGNSVQQFIPTNLGVALIEGYNSIGLETSLGKPFLRKEMEIKMRQICAGTKSRNDFIQETLDEYRGVLIRTQQQVDLLKAACRKSNPMRFETKAQVGQDAKEDRQSSHV